MTALNIEKQERLTPEVLRSRVSYDPSTGKMIWRVCQHWSRIGKEVGCEQNGYRGVTFPEGNFRVHRLAWLYFYSEWPSGHIDHINGIRSDNRIVNLRVATLVQNNANRRPQVGFKLKGITKHKDRWQAQIRGNGRNIYLGRFDTPEAAHEAYSARAIELYGEFARVK